jgi:hypothetical protein
MVKSELVKTFGEILIQMQRTTELLAKMQATSEDITKAMHFMELRQDAQSSLPEDIRRHFAQLVSAIATAEASETATPQIKAECRQQLRDWQKEQASHLFRISCLEGLQFWISPQWYLRSRTAF